MTDPTRLLLSETSEEERRLLQAGAADEPPADGAARLALALGVAASLPAGTGAAQTAGKAVAAKLSYAKLTVIGALLAGAGALAVLTLSSPAPAPRAERTPKPTSERGSPEADAAARAEEPNDLPRAAREAQPAANGGEASTGARSLADEVARLDRARRALSARKLDGALATLDAYLAYHPRGALAPEALRLRVEVWLAKGDQRRAGELARAFLRAYPQSPHAATLRRIAEHEPNDEANEEP